VGDDQYRAIRNAIGAAPAHLDGFSRAQLKALAALARSPRGLVSARAVARRAGVSAATASKELGRLQQMHLVEQRVERVALGRARDVAVWHAARQGAGWPQVARLVSDIALPIAARELPKRVPNELLHLFWNTAQSQLDPRTAGEYIARRLITTGDLDGLAWGAEHLDPAAWIHAAESRGLSARDQALARNLAAS